VPLDKPYYGCPFPEAFLRFWKKYVVFKGRASRSEFWWWTLANAGVNIVLYIILELSDGKTAFLGTIWSLATFIPMLALIVRRLHDIDKPGWLVAIYYVILLIGSVLIFIGAGSALLSSIGGAAYGFDSAYGTATAGSIVALIIGVVAMLAAGIVGIVFMAMPSKPEGARFDADYTVGAPYGDPSAPGAGYGPTPAMPMPDYGQPTGAAPAYGQPTGTTPEYGQPSAPAPGYGQPTVPGPNGENNQSSWQNQ
jgi:uncharacterized membrane protein YhaH (DUF805 family)